MMCFVCAREGGLEKPAVAICPNCSAGLCMHHVEELADVASGPGGTDFSCPHDTWVVPARD